MGSKAVSGDVLSGMGGEQKSGGGRKPTKKGVNKAYRGVSVYGREGAEPASVWAMLTVAEGRRPPPVRILPPRPPAGPARTQTSLLFDILLVMAPLKGSIAANVGGQSPRRKRPDAK